MTDDKITPFPGGGYQNNKIAGRTDIEPRAVLEAAMAAPLRSVVVCGLYEDGKLFGAASPEHLADTLLLLERVKMRLLGPMRDNDEFE